MTVNGRLRRISTGSAGILDAARCPACSHAARIHNAAGCVSAQCECNTSRAELMPDAPRLEVPDGVESTPAAPPAKPTPPVVAAAPAPAAAPAVPTPDRAEAARPADDRVVEPKAPPTVTLRRPDDELLEVRIGRRLIAAANHDEHGWSGMDAVERTAVAVARACGAEVQDRG